MHQLVCSAAELGCNSEPPYYASLTKGCISVTLFATASSRTVGTNEGELSEDGGTNDTIIGVSRHTLEGWYAAQLQSRWI